MRHPKKTLAGSLAFLLLAVSTIAFAQETVFPTLEAELADLNTSIHTRGAKWKAAETSLSRLSAGEKQKRVGTSELQIDAKPIAEDVSMLRALPASLDWRTNNGNFVSAVKDQAKCGSCWAFAMTGGLEANALLTRSASGAGGVIGIDQVMNDCGGTGNCGDSAMMGKSGAYARSPRAVSGEVSFSEQVLISCGGVGSCDGGTLNADFLKTTGLPPTSYYPYTATNGDCSSAASGWQKAAYKIGEWGTVSHSLSAIKSALAKYGPLPTAFTVYGDFMHYKSGVYTQVSGKKMGGHAVLIVGYNDDEQYFIVKNSWGTDWGEDGYFRIAYSELESKARFGTSTIAYQPASPTKYYSNLAKRGMGESAGKNISQKIGALLDQRP